MSIVTQCPSCATTFRVTPPQLQAQHGMVRCGRCAQVFDGFKTLATLPEAPPESALPPTAAPEASTPAPAAAVEVIMEAPSPAVPAPAADEATIAQSPV